MFPGNFDYVRADSLTDALSLLAQEDAKVLAGGHSLVPLLKQRLAQPSTLVDISKIDELRGISVNGGTVRVGALTTHHEVASSEALQEAAPILAEAAGKIGDPQVRNRGTVGGNIAHADPASDLPAVLVALGATIHIQGPNGARETPAAGFFQGLMDTGLEENEILVAVTFDALSSGDGSAYVKFEHPASGYAICGAAAVLRGDTPSLAFNGVAVVPHAVSTGDLGSDLSDEGLTAALSGLAIEDPLSDIHASAEYRNHLAKVFGARALGLARDRRG